MKSRKCLPVPILVLLVLFFSPFIHSQRLEPGSEAEPDLDKILQKCAEYCAKLAGSALDFVCFEKIKEEIFYSPRVFVSKYGTRYTSSGRSTQKNVYIYDYQLIRKDLQVKERRTLVEENGEKKDEKNARLRTHLFGHENIIFGPVGLLSEFWQQYYQYKIIKTEKLMGEKTFVIEATPIPYLQTNNLYGKIWIKKDDFSILKIEWDQASIRNYELIEENAQKLNAKPLIKFYSEYGYEKNGIRFPSKYSVTEIYIHKRGIRYMRSRTTVTYKNYKFFTVETQVKYEVTEMPVSNPRRETH